MPKNSLIKRNILQYIDYKGISKYKFYKLTGITRGFLDSPSGSSEETIAKFISYFKDVDISWLLTGKGNMLKKPENKQKLNHPVPAQKKIIADPRIYEIQELASQLDLTSFGISKDLGISYQTIDNILLNGPRATRSKTLNEVLSYLQHKAGHTGTIELKKEFVIISSEESIKKAAAFNKLSIEEKLNELYKQIEHHHKKTDVAVKFIELIHKKISSKEKL